MYDFVITYNFTGLKARNYFARELGIRSNLKKTSENQFTFYGEENSIAIIVRAVNEILKEINDFAGEDNVTIFFPFQSTMRCSIGKLILLENCKIKLFADETTKQINASDYAASRFA